MVDAPLDYNLILGWSRVNEMKAAMSSVFPVLKFPKKGKIVMIDRLSYCVPDPVSKSGMNIPFVADSGASLESVGVGMFNDLSLMVTFPLPPLVFYVATLPVYTILSVAYKSVVPFQMSYFGESA